MGAGGPESQWRGSGRQLERVQNVAHLSAEGIIDELVLANARQPLERSRYHMRGPMIVIAGEVGQAHVRVGQLGLDTTFDFRS
jgi:hypothetical protein